MDAQAEREFKAQLVSCLSNLYGFAMSLCNNHDRSSDLVQETVAKALPNRDTFVLGTNMLAWLFTILRNLYYDEYRKRRREVEDSDGRVASRVAVPSSQNGYMDFRDFHTALQTLPSEQREALILVGARGMSYAEVASMTDVSIGTVKSRVHRARAALKRLLGLTDGDIENVAPCEWGTKKSYAVD